MKNIISLYVHIPFCVKKCLFCSFAVSIGSANRVDEYMIALEKEAGRYKGATLATIYLGGGTPSFLTSDQMNRLIIFIRNNFIVFPEAHWSMEANPEGVDFPKAEVLKRLGFNRISLGVQSFNDAYLKFLGRAHDQQTAVHAFHILREAGFTNLNVDLMYGFPGQSRRELEDDLNAVVALGPEHVSLYTLTIEPNSRFYAKQMKLDDEGKLADDYVFVTKFLEQAGYKQYEVSNFAKPGFESKHNRVYWQGGEYIGLGMGAHSFIDNKRYWNVSTLNTYIEKTNAEGHAMDDEEVLSKETLMHERLIFGLRMNQGIDVNALENEFQRPFAQKTKDELEMLVKEGFLGRQGSNVATTLKGRLVLDEIASRLI